VGPCAMASRKTTIVQPVHRSGSESGGKPTTTSAKDTRLSEATKKRGGVAHDPRPLHASTRGDPSGSVVCKREWKEAHTPTQDAHTLIEPMCASRCAWVDVLWNLTKYWLGMTSPVARLSGATAEAEAMRAKATAACMTTSVCVCVLARLAQTKPLFRVRGYNEM
jgi:hypothetical protein